MRIVLLIVGALIILGGAGAGAYFYFGQQAQASVGADGEHAKAAEAAEEEEADDGHGGGKGGKFVELDPLVLPIIDEGGVTQLVSIVIVIEVSKSNKAEEVKQYSPRLKDAYIQDMYGILNRHAAMKGGVVQIGMIKQRLNRVTKDVLGPDVVKDVLLQVVQQRPI